MVVLASKNTRTNLPNRLLLWLRVVLALPNASITGFDCMMRVDTSSASLPPLPPATRDRYRSMSLVVSVFPLPLSPQMMMLALARPPLSRTRLSVSSATTKQCGGSAPLAGAALARAPGVPWYARMMRSLYRSSHWYGFTAIRMGPVAV